MRRRIYDPSRDSRRPCGSDPVPAKPSVQAGVSRFADSDSDSDSDSTVNPPTMRCSENGRTDMYMQVAYKYARVGQHPHFSKPSEIRTAIITPRTPYACMDPHHKRASKSATPSVCGTIITQSFNSA